MTTDSFLQIILLILGEYLQDITYYKTSCYVIITINII